MANLPPFPSGDNPWGPKAWNVTHQSVYARANGEDAAEAAANEAGTTLGASQAQSQQYRNNPKSLQAALQSKSAAKTKAAAAVAARAPKPPSEDDNKKPIPGPPGPQGKRGLPGPKGSHGAPGTLLLHEYCGVQAEGLFLSDQHFIISGPPGKCQFPQFTGLDGNRATCQFKGTNDTHFYFVTDAAAFLQDGSALICTVTFPANTAVGTFAYNGQTIVDAGQPLFLVCDHIADPTLAEIQILFVGNVIP